MNPWILAIFALIIGLALVLRGTDIRSHRGLGQGRPLDLDSRTLYSASHGLSGRPDPPDPRCLPLPLGRAGRSVQRDPGGEPEPRRPGLGISLVDLYLNDEPPGNILAVKEPLLAPVVNSASVYLEKPLLVVPDLITRPADEAPMIREIETSGRAFSDSEVATSPQPTAYVTPSTK